MNPGRTVLALFLSGILTSVLTGAAGAIVPGSVGPGRGIVQPGRDEGPCPGSALCTNFDGSAENGYCWQYGGTGPPYWGAFAECCDFGGPACVCGIQLILTSVGYACHPCTLFIWDDAGGEPGTVLSMTPGADPCPVAVWPTLTTYDFRCMDTQVNGRTWIGYWANWDEAPCGYFIAADTNGFGGCPYTYIVYGLGPVGWNNVSVVWGPTQSIGIGAWWKPGECGSTPTRDSSWGSIKRLYQ